VSASWNGGSLTVPSHRSRRLRSLFVDVFAIATPSSSLVTVAAAQRHRRRLLAVIDGRLRSVLARVRSSGADIFPVP